MPQNSPAPGRVLFPPLCDHFRLTTTEMLLAPMAYLAHQPWWLYATYAAYLSLMLVVHNVVAPAILWRCSGTYRKEARDLKQRLVWRNIATSMVHAATFFTTAVIDFSDGDFSCRLWTSNSPFQEACFAIMLAYLTYDTFLVIVTYLHGTITFPMFVGYSVHHWLGIISYLIVLGGKQGGEFGTYVHLSELSTVFLHIRWFYERTKRSEALGFLITSALFALCFTATRVLLPMYMIIQQYSTVHLWTDVWRGQAVFAISLVFYALQLMWFVEVATGVKEGVQALLKPKPKSS